MPQILSDEDIKAFNQLLQKIENKGEDQQRLKKVTGFFCEAPGEWSMRRLLCFCAFVFGVAICFLGLKYEITETVKTIAITILSLSFGAMAAGRFAEAMDKGGQ